MDRPVDQPINLSAELHFKAANYQQDQELCLYFREDAWLASYGNLENYHEHETREWFSFLTNKCRTSPRHYFFVHIWHDDKIIGQLEYQIHPNQGFYGSQGYINLFYIAEPYRQQGIGQYAHDWLIEQFARQRCMFACLRYIPGNTPAENFYRKNGWEKYGQPDSKGQMMEKTLGH